MLNVIPSIDLREGRVVRLKQGDFDQQTTYDLSPQETAAGFKAAGAKYLHIVDLDGARDGMVAQSELVRDVIAASGLDVQVGGGVRSEQDIDRLIGLGARRVVVGTKAVEDWAWFEGLMNSGRYDGQLILALDARQGRVATRGWTSVSELDATELAKRVKGWKLAGILYTDVAVDGMLTGPNLHHTQLLAEATDVPVIASGGVGNIQHIHALTKIDAWGVIVGRAIYEGKVDLKEALNVAASA